MKKLFFYTLLLGISLTGCAERQEARQPVSRSSGSFLKKSIEISKELIASEEALFESVMKENPQTEYLTSQKGYWYVYLKKSQTEDYLPQAGDLVYFDSEITDIQGDTIYATGELETREYMIDKEEIIIGLRDGIKR
ncbi:MAG: gliding motility-associated peptidyl-prolyl isomerase GldI, partial [Flavobacteriaceae bacterium]